MSAAVNSSAATICARNGTAHDGTLLCYWSDGPDTRGTLDLVWLCLSTLIICVWSAVHPGVPAPGSSWFRRFRMRIGWLLTGLFMPEVLVLIALAELRQAMDLLRAVEEAGVLTEFPWWMFIRKSWRPQKSGTKMEERFLLKVVRWFRTPASDKEESSISLERQHPWTLTHSFYAIMGGFYGTLSRRQDQPDDSSRCLSLSSASVLDWVWENPASIPNVSADDLNDRSKADGLTKALLVLQLSYFLANCVARWAQVLPLSLLEITTISHSLCSLVALLLWLYKPNNVQEVAMIGGGTPPKSPVGMPWWDILLMVLPGDSYMDVPRVATVVLIAALYGLPHLIGLSVQFPSGAEQMLWKIATCAVIGLPLAVSFTIYIAEVVGRSDSTDTLSQILCLAFMILYPVCSLFLVGESLRQVVALPEQSFSEAQLIRYMPGFS